MKDWKKEFDKKFPYGGTIIEDDGKNYSFFDIKYFIATLLDQQKEELVNKLEEEKQPMEDDEETTLYRHCHEGDHWKCSGYGMPGRCVCRCHALDRAVEIVKKPHDTSK